MQKQRKFALLLFALALSLNFAFAQDSYSKQLTSAYEQRWAKLDEFYISDSAKYARKVMQDNELDRKEVGQSANFHKNPLMLNGKQLDYSRFSMGSKGVLTLVSGHPNTKEATPILFYVYIRHEGTIVVDKTMRFYNKPLDKINLSEIFPYAQDGDVLIIKPVLAENWKAKRILKLFAGGC